MVLEQVYLVDVEEAAMRTGKKAGFESLFTGAQGTFQIERTDDAVFGCAQRQVDEWDRTLASFGRPAGIGAGVGGFGRTAVAAILYHRDGREQRGKSAGRGGLSGATVTEHHHPADGWIDRSDQESELHLVLTDDRREGKARHLSRSVDTYRRQDKNNYCCLEVFIRRDLRRCMVHQTPSTIGTTSRPTMNSSETPSAVSGKA